MNNDRAVDTTTPAERATRDKHKKRKGLFFELKNHTAIYLLILPAAAYIFLYGYMTLPYVVIAFQKYNFRTSIFSPWVGLENFEYFFSSTWAWVVTRNTLVINGLFLAIGTFIAILLALMLNEIRNRSYLKIAQSSMIFPFFISWVIVSYMLQGLIGTEKGLFNNMLSDAGRDRIMFYSESKYWYPILVILHIWKSTGYNSIIYLAAITGIDESIYESAYIDGANRSKRIRYITLPLIKPTIIVLLLMSIGRIFYGDFGMLYAIVRDNSALMPIAEVIDTYVFRTFKNTGNPSLSMAIGLYQSTMGFILVSLSNYIVRKRYPEGALF